MQNILMTKSPARLIDLRRAPHICISWSCQESCTVSFINLALDLLQVIIFASFLAFAYMVKSTISYILITQSPTCEKMLIDFRNCLGTKSYNALDSYVVCRSCQESCSLQLQNTQIDLSMGCTLISVKALPKELQVPIT